MRMMAELRLWALSIGTTLLIWFAADQRVSTSCVLEVPFSLKTASKDLLSVELVDPPVLSSITVELRGPNRIVNELKAGPEQLSFNLEVTEDKSGVYSLKLKDELRNRPELLPEGLSIQSATPDTISVSVDRFVRRDVTLAADTGNLEFEGELQLDPPVVTVTVAESKFEALSSDQRVIKLPIAPSFSQIPEGQPVQRTLVIPKRLSELTLRRVEPDKVEVIGTLRARTRILELPTIPIKVTASHEIFNRYAIQLDGHDGPTTRRITLRGPLQVVARLEKDPGRVFGMVEITSDDAAKMQGQSYSKEPRFIGLPEGVTLEQDVERVEVELTPLSVP